MTAVLIPAAGVGSRFGAAQPKQYIELAGKTVLQHTVDLFAANARINHIAVVVSPDDARFGQCVTLPPQGAVYRVGGASRAETVANGLNYLLQQGLLRADEAVLVHDAARCCLPQEALDRLLDQALGREEGGILALPVADTLKRQTAAQTIAVTVPRDGLWQAQTPQLFQAALLQRAFASADLAAVTDEAGAVERLGIRPLLVPGDPRNIKLTRAGDAALVEYLLRQR